jgi:threonine efflux protein
MISSLVAIALLHWAVLLVPGFNVVLIGQLAAGGSRAAALFAVVGMTTATLIWASLAVLGVGAVFSTHPQLRFAAQIAGGAYLLYLAVKLWRSGAAIGAQAPTTLGKFAALRIGLVTSLLNQKIALFYGSVFATSLPPAPSLLHIASAIAVVYANSIVWHASLAVLLSHHKVQQVYLRNFARLSKVSGAMVGAFGLRLIVATLQEIRSRGGSAA